MSSDIRRLRAQRVASDAAAYAEARAILENTLARRAEAQRVLDEISREAAVSEDVARTLAARLDESRYALVGVCVEELPDDILRCVFEMLVGHNVAGDYEPRAPFILAAVCARWRKVALSSPRMWSTVHAVPSHPARGCTAAAHARITTLLSRSRAAPLDIIALWPTDTRDPSSKEVFRDILELLAAHVLRWRTAVLYLPQTDGRVMLECLKGPTPLLEHLDCLIEPSMPRHIRQSEKGYLPFAPKLRTLELAYIGIECSTLSAFPALKRLHINSFTSTEEALYNYLIRAPSLIELDLALTVNSAPRTKIALSKLRSLHIAPGAHPLLLEPVSTFLDLPELADLHLDCALDVHMGAFFDAVSPTVRVLSVLQCLDSEDLSLLRRLQNVDTLDMSQELIYNAALEQLASADPPIWPRLSVIRNMGYTSDTDAHMLRFLTARNVAGLGTFGTAARPSKILQLGFRAGLGDPDPPSWLLQEVERLLRL